MSPSLTTFLFETANFVALAAALGWLFFKPVRAALQAQRERTRKQLADAAAALAEAKQSREQAEAARRALAGELEQMRSHERELAKQERESILNEARRRGEAERAALLQEATRLGQSQLAELSAAAATAASEAVRALLQQIAGPDLELALTAAACRELRALGDGAPLEPIAISSATPLSEAQRAALAAALGEVLPRTELRVDPALLSGIRIGTAAGLIDASALGLARYAALSLRAALHADGQESPGDA